MRGPAAGIAAIVTGLGVVPAASVQATADPKPYRAAAATTCQASYDIAIRPGLSAQKAHGTTYSPKPGTISCDGPLAGQSVTGAGTITVISRYGVRDGASCLGGDGIVTFWMHFPTADGHTQTLAEVADYDFGGVKHGIINGEFTGETMDGTFSATPTQGNCVTTPLSPVHLNFTAILRPYGAPRKGEPALALRTHRPAAPRARREERTTPNQGGIAQQIGRAASGQENDQRISVTVS